METVQLAIQDRTYAAGLRELLLHGGAREVACVGKPDSAYDGVIVVDPEGLNSLPSPLLHPERIVLITRNDPQHLAEAWDAGIRSVVFEEEPLTTAVLAVLAAGLRVPKPESHACCHTTSAGAPSGPGLTGSRRPPKSTTAAAAMPGAGGSRPKQRRG